MRAMKPLYEGHEQAGGTRRMAERLHSGDATLSYDAMLAAEHVLRYHSVRKLCPGKRVLDVACREGYGSALLAEWGASEVVGIDISAEAVATAREEFSHPNITFIQGDACCLDSVLGDAPGFDLIVSFETIEHVSDVSGLLAGIRQYCIPQGTIVISCPNGQVEESDNPSHERCYTFDEFRSVVSAGLGPASGWMLGTPAHGYILYPPGDPRMENKGDCRMRLIGECRDLENAAAIPAQSSVAPGAGICTFYIGYWGGAIGSDAVISPQSHVSFVEPLRTLTQLRKEREQISLRQEDLRIAKAQLERQLADLRRRVLVQARVIQQQREQVDSDLAQLRLDAQRWATFQKSTTYRLMQLYVRSYSMPAVGPVLRLLRKMAGWMWRVIRPG